MRVVETTMKYISEYNEDDYEDIENVIVPEDFTTADVDTKNTQPVEDSNSWRKIEGYPLAGIYTMINGLDLFMNDNRYDEKTYYDVTQNIQKNTQNELHLREEGER
jgi:hypothetical protein